MKKIIIVLFCIKSFSLMALEVGAQRIDLYLPLLQDKNIALVVNQTSRVGKTHLIDFLLDKNIKVKKLFALEHGLRGHLDAGEDVQNGVDVKTGLPVISLYGKNKMPQKKDLKGIDLIIFDIQDVGVRFYTYISSLYYVLKACSDYKKYCLVLDRPNPLAHRIEGPVLKLEQQSFLGMYPIPVIYGLTIGELANMILGQKWVNPTPKLKVIKIKDWKRNDQYQLPIKPSPNLPTGNSIQWYPSLALFEPTIISVGRGTSFPFEVIGYPDASFGSFRFTPRSIEGMSKYPKHQDKVCFGHDFRNQKAESFTLSYLIKSYQKLKSKKFFKHKNFFNKLIGDSKIYQMIKDNLTAKQIKKYWQNDLEKYKKIRKRYLYYE